MLEFVLAALFFVGVVPSANGALGVKKLVRERCFGVDMTGV